MIKAVIFDMDGTIGDTMPLILRSFRDAIEPLIGRSVSDEELTATFGPSEEATILALIPEYYKAGVKAYYGNYKTYHADFPQPFDGIKELLEYLKSKQIRLGLVTGKGPAGTGITLRQYGLENTFEAIDTGVPEAPRKPKGLRAVLSQFGLQPEEAIYVGDTTGDIMACAQVGIPIISAAWAGTAETQKLKELNPELTFENVDAFSDYIKRVI